MPMSDDSDRRGPLSLTPATEGTGPLGSTATGDLTVPRYRMLGLVGIGGMGVVYRAEDTHLGRSAALKFLPPTLTPNQRAKLRFLDEARAASGLDHPNICTIYEIGETPEGQLYLAMAFYEGETLKRRLSRGPLPVAEALRIALQVAQGLAKAHQHGIVHRDIKPANLMITKDGIVKILDFGIALLPEQGPSAAPLLGTPGYMSPEQERGEAVDARSDVWALGVVLHEMLTGRLPDRGEHEEDPRVEGPTVSSLQGKGPSGIDGVLSRMLAEEPAGRYPDATALLADLAGLERAAAGKDAGRTPGLASRRGPASAILLLVATLVISAVSWLLWSPRRQGGGPDPSHATFDQLTDLAGREWFPSLDPDGQFFVYSKKVGDRSRLFLQYVDGGRSLDLLPDSQEGDSQPALSPDGRQIAFRSERDGGGIFFTGVMGESVRRISDFGFNPAWSPDGKEILFATDGIYNPAIRMLSRSRIFRVNLETGQQRPLPTDDAVQPSWSPHGYRIAYWGILLSSHRVIWTIPAGGGKPVQVTDGKAIDWNPVWSPDGRYLYFASNRSGTTNLWRVPIDERSGKVQEPEPVTKSAQASMLPSLARDGRRIAYTTDDSRSTLERVAFDPKSGTISSPAVAITKTAQLINSCDVSRDGRWLLYQTFLPNRNIFLIHPDGSSPRQLPVDGFNRLPRWSPDGKQIAFYSSRGGKYEIWTIRADGSRLERAVIMPHRPRAQHPIWSPDNRQIAFDLEENEALIDVTRPLADRHPVLLPPPPGPRRGFSASSWSADGRWLAGALHDQAPLKQQLPGVMIYSLADRRYERVTPRGEGATWLSDSRHLLYWDNGRLLLLDTVSRTSRQVLTTPPGSEYNDFCLSRDDRTLYLARNTEEGDIWLLTMK
jgi:eukaryotic-like serine/threonine-protein kinase